MQTVSLRTPVPPAPHGFAEQSRLLLRLAGPIVLSQLGMVGMNTVDTLMVGPLGPGALAAVGLASALHMASIMVSAGVVVGMAPLVSQAFGAGDRALCRSVLVQGLWLSLLLSLPVIWFNLEGEALSLLLGQSPELSRVAGEYMAALAPGIPALLAFMALRQFLEGMNRVRPPMVATFLGLGLNALANAAFIYGAGPIPAMGVVGSGYATSLVRWSMAGGIALYLTLQPGLHPLRGAGRLPRLDLLRAIVKVGVPIGGQLGLEVGLFSFAAVMMGWIGPVELAAHQVTINVAATTFMVALGVSLAGTIRVGQEIGAGRTHGARMAAGATYVWATGFMALCALGFLAAPSLLISLYSRDPGVVGLGSSLLLVAAAFQLFDGGQVAGLCVLRGAADTAVPMLIAALSYWGVGLAVGYWAGFRAGWGPVGVWVGLSAGLAAAALLLAWRVRAVLWGKSPPARPAANLYHPSGI